MAYVNNQVYWVGQDGNIYLKNAAGVKNVGTPFNGDASLKEGGFDSTVISAGATRIADPNVRETPASTATASYGPSDGGASAAAAAQNAAMAQYYDSQTAMLGDRQGSLDGQLNTGLSNLSNSYNRSLNRLTDQKALTDRGYQDQTKENDTSYNTNKANVQANTRAQQNALQRLLGAAGAGNSSAAYEAAPYAAALEGTKGLTSARDTYSTNFNKLKRSYDDTLKNYNNSREDLDTQRQTNEGSLRSSIANARIDLLGQIAQASQNAAQARGGSINQTQQDDYRSKVASLLDQIANAGRTNDVALNTNVSYNAAQLDPFAGQRQSIAVDPGTSAADPTLYNPLLIRRDEQGNPIYQ